MPPRETLVRGFYFPVAEPPSPVCFLSPIFRTHFPMFLLEFCPTAWPKDDGAPPCGRPKMMSHPLGSAGRSCLSLQFVWGLGKVCLNGHSLCVGWVVVTSAHTVCVRRTGEERPQLTVFVLVQSWVRQALCITCTPPPWPSTLMGWWPLAGLSSVPSPADRFRVPVSALRVCGEDFSRVSSATLRGCGAQLWENREGFGVTRRAFCAKSKSVPDSHRRALTVGTFA